MNSLVSGVTVANGAPARSPLSVSGFPGFQSSYGPPLTSAFPSARVPFDVGSSRADPAPHFEGSSSFTLAYLDGNPDDIPAVGSWVWNDTERSPSLYAGKMSCYLLDISQLNSEIEKLMADGISPVQITKRFRFVGVIHSIVEMDRKRKTMSAGSVRVAITTFQLASAYNIVVDERGTGVKTGERIYFAVRPLQKCALLTNMPDDAQLIGVVVQSDTQPIRMAHQPTAKGYKDHIKTRRNPDMRVSIL